MEFEGKTLVSPLLGRSGVVSGTIC